MRQAKTAHLIALGLNVALALSKLVVGFLAGSEALIADGFNSAGDVFATGIGLAGFLYASKPADDDHHFGHGNAENVAGLVIGGVLLATGAFIFLRGILAVFEGRTEPPAQLALWVAGATAVIKEGLYRYATHVGRATNSPSLLASARDHRADVMVALTVFAGVLAARTGMPTLDPLAATLVGGYVAYLSIEPIRSNIATLMDQAPPELRERVRDLVSEDADVISVERVRIHPLGSYYMVDLDVVVSGSFTLEAAHDIAHRVADRIRNGIEHVRDAKVHVSPGVTPGPT